MDAEDIYQYAINCIKSGAADIHQDEAGMPCPNSGCDDEGGHFSINTRKGLFNCYKCHFSGSILSIISRNRSEWLLAVGTPRGTKSPPKGRVFPFCGTPLYVLQQGGLSEDKKKGAAPKPFSAKTAAIQAYRAEEYCLKRGMTREQIAEYRVSIKSLDPRIYFPYWNEEGELTFWMGRAINDVVEPKTTEPTDSVKPLFGRHVKRLERLVVLVEGVFDHFVTPSSYALMGSGITGEQISQLMLDGIKRVFLLQDPDAAEVMTINSRKLGQFNIKAHICMLGGNRDPAEIGAEIMRKVVSELRHSYASHRLVGTIHLNI